MIEYCYTMAGIHPTWHWHL